MLFNTISACCYFFLFFLVHHRCKVRSAYKKIGLTTYSNENNKQSERATTKKTSKLMKHICEMWVKIVFELTKVNRNYLSRWMMLSFDFQKWSLFSPSSSPSLISVSKYGICFCLPQFFSILISKLSHWVICYENKMLLVNRYDIWKRKLKRSQSQSEWRRMNELIYVVRVIIHHNFQFFSAIVPWNSISMVSFPNKMKTKTKNLEFRFE